MKVGTFLRTFCSAGIAVTMMLSPVKATEIPATETATAEEIQLPTLQDRYYPADGVVTELDEENDRVIYTDFNRNMWDFPGIEDWAEGDKVALIMDNMGTPNNIYDDEPVCWRYTGWYY